MSDDNLIAKYDTDKDGKVMSHEFAEDLLRSSEKMKGVPQESLDRAKEAAKYMLQNADIDITNGLSDLLKDIQNYQQGGVQPKTVPTVPIDKQAGAILI